MSNEAVLYEISGGVATITLNRPDRMNTFNEAMFSELNAAVARFKTDDDARVCILTAAGTGAFSAGLDIDASNAVMQEGSDRSEQFDLDFLDDDLGGKPVIFACFGHCVGQAMALGGWADIRIAADTTLFSLPEAKIGISAVTLPGLLEELIGVSQAAYALLYGGQLDANWALRSGFVHEVVQMERLKERAEEIAAQMSLQAPLALKAHKSLLRMTTRQSREDVIAKGMEFRKQTMGSRDFREGLRAFLEKRRPQFEGR